MPESKAKIMRHCIVCGKPFLAKNVDSVHCSKKCSNETYRNKKRAEKREIERQAILAESEGYCNNMFHRLLLSKIKSTYLEIIASILSHASGLLKSIPLIL